MLPDGIAAPMLYKYLDERRTPGGSRHRPQPDMKSHCSVTSTRKGSDGALPPQTQFVDNRPQLVLTQYCHGFRVQKPVHTADDFGIIRKFAQKFMHRKK